MTTGDIIRKIRKTLRLTQAQFGAGIDVSRPSVTQWENDDHKPKADKIWAICEAWPQLPASLMEQLVQSVYENKRVPLELRPFLPNTPDHNAVAEPKQHFKVLPNAPLDADVSREQEMHFLMAVQSAIYELAMAKDININATNAAETGAKLAFRKFFGSLPKELSDAESEKTTG
ncbi:helix-turn-helix domain-containing protein [Bowmanella denitrificans]|uniref:helix-turn-helix domain-containing protein n=1 Tax=Bowmanella denitrificans TaxID=366582 RepID=UPI000C997E7F|nr:helix-turn-helix transcriptional regulator [Bowmanella denitrificans]